jgi:predicted RNA binding protein YcfA (HicA-like mRNA interferase family)
MSRFEKVLLRILRGTSDVNFQFDDLRHLLQQLGFDERVRGSHHIYVQEILQPAASWRERQAVPGQTGSSGNPEVPPGWRRR